VAAKNWSRQELVCENLWVLIHPTGLFPWSYFVPIVPLVSLRKLCYTVVYKIRVCSISEIQWFTNFDYSGLQILITVSTCC
jgi:hypothetical protein